MLEIGVKVLFEMPKPWPLLFYFKQHLDVILQQTQAIFRSVSPLAINKYTRQVAKSLILWYTRKNSQKP